MTGNNFLPDTNIISEWLKGDSAIADKIDQAETIYIPAIVVGEMYYGAQYSTRVEKNIEDIARLTERYPVLHVNASTAALYGIITESFDNDIKKLPEAQQNRIKDEINHVSGSLLNGRSSFMEKASMPYVFSLKGGLDSSLYVVKVDEDKKMVVAVDDDPIFNKVLLTMYRPVDENDAGQIYKEVGEQLYKSIGVL